MGISCGMMEVAGLTDASSGRVGCSFQCRIIRRRPASRLKALGKAEVKMRVGVWFLMTFSTIIYLFVSPLVVWAEGRADKFVLTPQLMPRARHLYGMRCARCHGLKGDGNGRIADLLEPRPRDFTSGMFKFRTTASGELPTDEDLYTVISRGIPGTSMPRWERVLSEAQRRMLVAYIKTFAEEFTEPQYDPYKAVVTIPPIVPSSPRSIAKGRQLYEVNKCWECHGKAARGDGITGLEDDWGFPVRVPNLTRKWNLKGGSNPRDIVYRITTGLNGTPMPSFAESIRGEDRWHLANYIVSISQGDVREDMMLRAEKTNKAIPLEVDAEIWRPLTPTKIFLRGQRRVTPFWINNAVDIVDVRAVYNQREIGFLIAWDDPVRDRKHDQGQEVKTIKNRFVKAVGDIPRKPGTFRDAIALQFPVNPVLQRQIPLLRGDSRHPVNLWVWKSDLEATGGNPVEDSNARGGQTPIQIQPEAEQQVRGKGVWKDGRWRVVMVRSLRTKDKHDIQFAQDRIIPIAFNSWEGSNGEHGMIMGLSAWHLVYLDVPPAKTFRRMKDILSFFGLSREFPSQ